MIVLHIGTDKAGSTAIQKLFTVNRDFLEKERWLYPKEIGDWGTGHSRLDKALKKNNFTILQELKKEIENSYLDNVLLSSEGFYGLDEKQIIQFVSVLNSLKLGEVKIIIYLRRQDDKNESGILQNIKSGKLKTLTMYNYRYQPAMDYNAIIEKWNKYIKKENVIIRPYGKQFLPNKYSIFEDFFQHALNIDFNEVKEVLLIPQKDPNPSLDAVSGYVADFIDRVIKDESKDIFISQLLAIQNRYGKTKSYLFDTSERKSILSLYKKGNEALIKEYNVPKELFEMDDNKYEKPTEAEIAARLLVVYKRRDYLLPLENWHEKQNLLSDNNINKRVMIQGFYKSDKHGIWTKGNEISKLAFLISRNLYNANEHIKLIIKCNYVAKSDTVSFMRIGKEDWIELSNDDQYKISTEEIRKDGGVAFLEFKHKNTISPKELNANSNDSRIMGCRIKSIYFEAMN